MTSKLGESPRKAAAAYLLFYRRRSDKPLGPQYLQDLVTDFRNPPQQQAPSADEASESDSGEGRLGDPSSILRGSSSNSVGAGAGATGLQLQARSTTQGGGSGSAGQQAGQNLKPRTLGTSDDEGIGMDEDSASNNNNNNKLYGNIGEPSWGFEALIPKADNADSDAEMSNNFRDNDSTIAEQDSDRDERWNDVDEGFHIGDGYAMDNEYEDDHTMYSIARDDGTVHIEDTAMMSDDPAPVDINLSDDSHSKMD
jgi:ubiquitin carboxyl-terminal hydrolase 4/11/15